MAVYVDKPKWKLGRMIMCHMIADTTEELYSMAAIIGVDQKYVQYPHSNKIHFDICKAKRQSAIKHGAIEVSSRDIVKIIRSRNCSNEQN